MQNFHIANGTDHLNIMFVSHYSVCVSGGPQKSSQPAAQLQLWSHNCTLEAAAVSL